MRVDQAVPARRRGAPCEREPGHLDETPTSRITYTCACPPSTNSSIPVIKLLSSEARNTTALAMSSGSPNRPSGMLASIDLKYCSLCSSFSAKPLRPGVLVEPGLTALTRIFRYFMSKIQLRAKERTAALVAWYTLNPGSHLIEAS